MPSLVMRSRGFVQFEYLLVGALLIVLGSIAVSSFERVLRTRRQRTASAYVAEIAQFERSEHTRTGIYPDTLSPALNDSGWFVVLNADTTGWGVGVQGPSHSSIDVFCGMFEGDPRHTTIPGRSTPGEVTCE